MGYRSDVALCLSQNGISALTEKLDKSSPAIRDEAKELLDHPKNHFTDSATGSQFWYWEGLKWYEDFPDVGFIEHLMGKLDIKEYLFIRIGEDSDDNEIQGAYWNNPFGMCLSRSIEFTGSGE